MRQNKTTHLFRKSWEFRSAGKCVCVCVSPLQISIFVWYILFNVVKFNLGNYFVGYISIRFTTNKLLYCSTLQRIHNPLISRDGESARQNFSIFRIEFTLLLFLLHGVLIYQKLFGFERKYWFNFKVKVLFTVIHLNRLPLTIANSFYGTHINKQCRIRWEPEAFFRYLLARINYFYWLKSENFLKLS